VADAKVRIPAVTQLIFRRNVGETAALPYARLSDLSGLESREEP
jgi:hypothetical protein